MPAPTEQHAQDQRSDASDVSDARKRIGAYLRFISKRVEISDFESVLAAADRDRQFVEAARGAFSAPGESFDELIDHIDDVHQRIYGTPCTAKETK